MNLLLGLGGTDSCQADCRRFEKTWQLAPVALVGGRVLDWVVPGRR